MSVRLATVSHIHRSNRSMSRVVRAPDTMNADFRRMLVRSVRLGRTPDSDPDSFERIREALPAELADFGVTGVVKR